MNLRPHQTAIACAVVVGVLSTMLPFLHWFFLPVNWLDTHIHELCHAIAGWACGAEVGPIKVFGDGSGVTYIAGGNELIDTSAGYVGASIVGALTIFFSRTPLGARVTLRVLSGALAISMILLVRGDLTGEISGVFWTVALFGLSYLPGLNSVFFAQLLGVMQCLYAVQALYELLQISAFSEGVSDAKILAQSTGIAPIVWAVGWGLFSLSLMGFTLYRAWITPTAQLRAGSFGKV